MSQGRDCANIVLGTLFKRKYFCGIISALLFTSTLYLIFLSVVMLLRHQEFTGIGSATTK